MSEGSLMDQVPKYGVSDGSHPSSPVNSSGKLARSRSPTPVSRNKDGASSPNASSFRKSRSHDKEKEKQRSRSPKCREKSRERSSERTRRSQGEFRTKGRSPVREKKSQSPRRNRHRRSRSRSHGPDNRGRESRSRGTEQIRRSSSPSRSRGREKIQRSQSPSRGKDRRSRSRDRRNLRRRSRTPDRRRGRDYRYRSPDRRSPKRRMKEHLVQQAARQTQETLELMSKLSQASNVAAELEKPSNLPLNNVPAGQITPQILLQQTMAIMNAKTQALTGVALPKYYNIAAVNPLKYAEQIQKRKLLWHGNKEKAASVCENKDATSAHWEKATFSQDQDGKMTAKFRKLMGIKDDHSSEMGGGATAETPDPCDNPTLNQQEALFRDLDMQYEVARMSTHTHRGVGLGYSTHAMPIFPK